MSQPTLSPLTTAQTNAAVSRKLFVAAVVLILLGFIALTVDMAVVYPFVTKSPGPIWEWCRSGIQKLVKPGETFANGWAIALLLMAFYAVDTARRRGLLRIATIILTAGMGANIGKLIMGRWRPKAYFDATIDEFPGHALDSFCGWMPWAGLGYTGQSVPSGHTATAIALTIVLCRRWPHARWAFVIVQRLSYWHH